MKKFNILFLVLIFALISCNKDSDDVSHITLNGKKHELNTGYVQNMSWEGDEMGTFKITLASSSDNPETYFVFRLLSPSTSNMINGTYNYAWWPNNSYLLLGPELVTFDGYNLTEKDYSWSGTIDVSGKDTEQTFSINLSATSDVTNEVVSINGTFYESLTETF